MSHTNRQCTRIEINNEDFILDEETMMLAADSMACAASSFGHGGYDSFVSARQTFITLNHALFEAMRNTPRKS